MDYPLCCQTVTVYRQESGSVKRCVYTDCYYQWQYCQEETALGLQVKTTALLLVPQSADLRPGDRVLPGCGPETVAWETFLPAQVEGLCQLTYVRPWYWESRFSHWEAGAK